MRNKKPIIIIAAVLLVAVLGGGAYYFVKKNAAKPDETVQKYFELLNNEDYEGMYDLLSSDTKENVSKDDFVTRNKNIYEGIEADKIEVTVQSSSKSGNDADVNYDTKMNTMAGELDFSNSVKLVKEDKQYKMCWNSQVIFPELGESDKVRVSSTKSKRGSILDRNGNALAVDGTAAEIGIVPGKMTDKGAIDKIAGILDISADDINKKLSASYVKDDMFVAIDVIAKDDARVNELLSIQGGGIMVNDKASRIYPLGEAAAHLTGYVQTINADELEAHKDEDYNQYSLIGKTGLEKIYESTLKGTDGASIYITDKLGNKTSTIITRDVKDGQDVKLTIDSSLQSLMYSQLSSDKGASVAMNSSTGEVLALVSTPGYDPNEFVMGLSQSKWDSLNSDENKPLYNRFQSRFAPGSSFKPITAAVAIDTGSLDINAAKNIQGLKWQKDSSWGDYYVTRVEDYGSDTNFLNAMVYSDNIYFAQTALDIGSDKFVEKLSSFGIGEDIPFEYGLSASQISSDGNISTDIQLADSGYGQGEVLINPVQLASLYTMFVNDGNIVQPYLEYKDNSSQTVWKSNAVSKETAKTVLDALIQVVANSNGTGHEAYIDGRTIAGKTGTAEIKDSQDDTNGTETGWFVGMTTDKGKDNVLVLAMAEDAKDKGGSHHVVPMVKKALESIK